MIVPMPWLRFEHVLRYDDAYPLRLANLVLRRLEIHPMPKDVQICEEP